MKMAEVAIDAKFKYVGEVLTKIPFRAGSCCTPTVNCRREDGTETYLQDEAEVEPVE